MRHMTTDTGKNIASHPIAMQPIRRTEARSMLSTLERRGWPRDAFGWAQGTATLPAPPR